MKKLQPLFNEWEAKEDLDLKLESAIPFQSIVSITYRFKNSKLNSTENKFTVTLKNIHEVKSFWWNVQFSKHMINRWLGRIEQGWKKEKNVSLCLFRFPAQCL